MTFHPSGRFVYVVNELSNTVSVFRYDSARGALESVQDISALPDGFSGASTAAEIHVHPSGRFLYSSNRGHNSIAIFAIDPETGSFAAWVTNPRKARRRGTSTSIQAGVTCWPPIRIRTMWLSFASILKPVCCSRMAYRFHPLAGLRDHDASRGVGSNQARWMVYRIKRGATTGHANN